MSEISIFIYRVLIDLVAVFFLFRLIYYRIYRRSDLFLTFFGFNIIIFLITYLLNKSEMSMGSAFGLFAVFSMLRYRTEGISAKDMTYLFLGVAIGLIAAIGNVDWVELIVLCGIILVGTFVLESNILIQREYSVRMHYDNISLITPEKRALLIEDLKNKTGLNIHRVEIEDIDMLKDSAKIIVFYH